jgi:two-component system, OmpR family, sensor kinase
MAHHVPDAGATPRQVRLLTTLERLLAITAPDMRTSLNQASQLINDTLGADKVDVFRYEPAADTLVAVGTSNTPMGQRQIALGLDRLALSKGGKTAHVFKTGDPYWSGQVDQDPDELREIREVLGVRSAIVEPFDVDGARRGCLQIDSAQPNRFEADDVPFLQAIAGWTGMVLQRAELVERITHEAADTARRTAAEELITILAHDLRAPLVALKGRALMMLMRAQREGHQANLTDSQGITVAANRLERMINDLMDTARLEQGFFTLTPTVLNLAALARETVVGLTTGEGEIELQAPDEVVVEGDSDRLRQILENLLSNARKYSPAGLPVSVQVHTEQRDDGEWATVEVRDQGPGIAPDLLPHLFTRFVAGRGTTGLGLGLYLARGIAEAHSGTLTVDSTIGAGTTFRLALPVASSNSWV